MKSQSPFAQLLGLQRAAEVSDRLQALRHKYSLAEDDPVWELAALHADFCVALLAEHHPDNVEPANATSAGVRRSARWRWFSLGLTVQTFIMALSFLAGSRGGSPALLPSGLVQPHVTRSWLFDVLTFPAGWMMLAFAMPLLAHGTRIGWRARYDEPAIGWSLVVCCTGAALASAAALYALL
jgi:hypothetical protein